MVSTRKIRVFAVAFFLLLYITSPVSLSVIPSIPRVHAVARTITLVGFASTGWNGSTSNPNPRILVVPGDTVTVLLSSGDGVTHRFVVDVDGDGKILNPICPPDKCSGTFPPSTMYPFTVDFAIGTYTYYCPFHPSSMFGIFLVVTAVGAPVVPVDKLALLAPFFTIAAIAIAAAAGVFYMKWARPRNK
jgi:hypothetical protein